MNQLTKIGLELRSFFGNSPAWYEMRNTLSARTCAHALKRTHMRGRMRSEGWCRPDRFGTRGAEFFYVNLFCFLILR